MWLDHPASYISAEHGGARYQNPHNPAPGVGARGADAERRRNALVSGIYGGSSVSAQKVVKAIDVQKQQVEEVFMNLKSGTDLEQVTPRKLQFRPGSCGLASRLIRDSPARQLQSSPPPSIRIRSRRSRSCSIARASSRFQRRTSRVSRPRWCHCGSESRTRMAKFEAGPIWKLPVHVRHRKREGRFACAYWQE